MGGSDHHDTVNLFPLPEQSSFLPKFLLGNTLIGFSAWSLYFGTSKNYIKNKQLALGCGAGAGAVGFFFAWLNPYFNGQMAAYRARTGERRNRKY